MNHSDTPILISSPADLPEVSSVGGEAATGAIPSRSPAARLIPDPFGTSTPDGALRLSVFRPFGQRTLRIELGGVAYDALVDDDTRDCLITLLTEGAR
ncbi:hypothetical protein MCBMB27_02621 [Methylobacterium phyllosphaerae]|uniref:Uncharacterized protein n=1 Tax=Methylobacterium phyllosphaerae TaxID=418223 RepID=A0AAE8L704_9HYPH|nr:hypothetical protein [Methylobacterium phyllosphaerae]APT31912.1 hypothetical protein MCBMB27_02621 [Methylobacterium phyllosphaerae]SFH01687.1 hypothetical protein SAMN05192567_11246 [Methylobacterium phyllosphaerae]